MTQPPVNLADRPATQADSLDDAASSRTVDGRSDDLLSELLRSVRLGGERVVAYGPPRTFSMGFADVGSLHIIEEGELELRIDGDRHVEHLRPGDVVLLLRGDPHHISNETDAPEPVRWLCGTFTIGDPQASHLLGALPAVIILGGARTPAPEGLEVARRMLAIEMHSPSQGSAVMISRILDLIFIQILRAWAAGTDAEPNWLAGAFDPQIGLTLSAIHRDPGHDWTVEELARVCNLSRSSFAARFVARVGKPPATYLAHVRLDAATDLLRDTSLPVTHIAERVGYNSEAAFSRAFKNRYGTPPARWRRDIPGRC
ncbi:MAG: transcriptional regulator, AraC family [Nocardia sp.]|uniref:AraC family transcriptional regulator n=1 Tax=Nocardia sp. TaxID=1821 RepID=UPI00262F505D|nr:AraC family transcriptional regulator [Nocardia sp.]MCU1647405.1 transcriptional regulator, AraC family [Nocardia sp.]